MDLSFGEFQLVVLGAFTFAMLFLTTIFVTVAYQSRRNVDRAVVTETGYRLRRMWLSFLIVFLGSGVVVSLFFLPYSHSDEPLSEVSVTGYQFNWTVDPAVVPVGNTVFDVTASDVNHGLGVYDPDGILIGNVQAMPEYHNKLELDLTKPGKYTLACLEYCGLDHHIMIRYFEVKP